MNSNNNTAHIETRLQQRGLKFSSSQLESIASKYNNDTAVILGKRPSLEGIGYNKIILIVRNRKPVTIMERRESQNFDKRNFQVNQVVYL